MIDSKIINFTKDNYLNHKKDNFFFKLLLTLLNYIYLLQKHIKLLKYLTMKYITYLIYMISVKF